LRIGITTKSLSSVLCFIRGFRDTQPTLRRWWRLCE